MPAAARCWPLRPSVRRCASGACVTSSDSRQFSQNAGKKTTAKPGAPATALLRRKGVEELPGEALDLFVLPEGEHDGAEESRATAAGRNGPAHLGPELLGILEQVLQLRQVRGAA